MIKGTLTGFWSSTMNTEWLMNTNGWDSILFPFRVTVGIYDIPERTEWIIDNFGPNDKSRWIEGMMAYNFARREDAALFMLFWGGSDV